MPFLKNMQINHNEDSANIYYEDVGSGKPVVLIHGWPLSHEMWDSQLAELPAHGLRCIAYDRRGFGRSEKPWDGYNYDVFSDDLHKLMEKLDLMDATLVGFSMGGGEVIRYLSKYSTHRVSKIVLISSIIPYMLQTSDNPDGMPREKVQEMEAAIKADRGKFLTSFNKDFFGAGLMSSPVSTETLNWCHSLAMQASTRATVAAMHAFAGSDFREEIGAIHVPTLLIHGDADKTVPLELTSKKAAAKMPNSELKVYENAPHGLFITDKERLNKDLISFICRED